MVSNLTDSEVNELWKNAQTIGLGEGLTKVDNLRHPKDLNEADPLGLLRIPSRATISVNSVSARFDSQKVISA